MTPRAVRPLLAAAVVAATLPVIASAQASDAVVAENVRQVTTVPGATGGHSVIEGDRLYVGAYGLGMRVFDIKDPAAPKVIGQYVPGPQPGQPDNDVGLRADTGPDAAVLDGRSIVSLAGTGRTAGTQQTEFLDFTDPAAPKLLWRFANAADGEAHNGDIVDARRLWMPSGAANLRIYDLNPLLGATPAAPAKVVDVNPRQLWEDSPFRGERPVGGPSSGLHDLEVYVDREVLLPQTEWTDSTGDGVADKTFAKRDIALLAEGGNYLAGNNSGSLYVIDITNPAEPVALLRYQRPAGTGKPVRYVHEAQFLDGQSDIVVTADEDLQSGCDNGGLVIQRLSEDLTSVTELSQWFMGTGTPAAVCSAHVMSSKGDYLFVGAYSAGLQVVDLRDPAKPVRGGQYIAAGANSWGALVNPTAPGYLTYVGDFGARGLDVFEFQPPGDTARAAEADDAAAEVCQGRTIPVAEGERLVTRTVYMSGENDVGNVDALQEISDGTPRLLMSDDAPTAATAKTFAGKNYVAGPNTASSPNFLLGYWNRELSKSTRLVCAQAVVFAATTQGNLTLQLWSGTDQLNAVAGKAAAATAAPYTVNFGPLDKRVSGNLLVQAVHDAPGSLLYYDAASRPSSFTYVTVEKA